MAKTISLDDLDTDVKKKKKKKKIVAASSAKKAKSVPLSTAKKSKTVSKGLKAKKNKTEPLSIDGIGADLIFADMEPPAPAPALQETQSDALEGQLLDAIAHVPPSVQRDNEQFQEYLMMFKACQKMARVIELRFEDRQSPRDVYPLMKLYEQMREIIADLRAIKDVTELGEVVNAEVISPLVESLGAVLIGYHQNVIAWINANCTNDQIANANHHLKKELQKTAKDMEQSYHNSLEKTMQIFAQEQ